MSKLIIGILVFVSVLVIVVLGTSFYFMSSTPIAPPASTLPNGVPVRPITDAPTPIVVPAAPVRDTGLQAPAAAPTPLSAAISIYRPHLSRCTLDGNEIDYVFDKLFGDNKCPEGAQAVSGVADFLLFQPSNAQPAGTLGLYLVENAGAPHFTYTLSNSAPAGKSTQIGWAWPPETTRANTQPIYVNSATIRGKVRTYLSSRAASEAIKYGWTLSAPLAVVPTSQDPSVYI